MLSCSGHCILCGWWHFPALIPSFWSTTRGPIRPHVSLSCFHFAKSSLMCWCHSTKYTVSVYSLILSLGFYLFTNSPGWESKHLPCLWLVDAQLSKIQQTKLWFSYHSSFLKLLATAYKFINQFSCSCAQFTGTLPLSICVRPPMFDSDHTSSASRSIADDLVRLSCVFCRFQT